MRLHDKCLECGTHLRDKNAREVGYCVSCYNMMMADPDYEEYPHTPKVPENKGMKSHWPVRADEDET